MDYKYLAGLADGEGSFSIGRSVRKNKRISYSCCFGISNTNFGGLASVVCEYGGNLRLAPNGNNSKYKTAYLVYFAHAWMKEHLSNLIPFLRFKQRQAEIVLEFLSIYCVGAGRWNMPGAKERHAKAQILFEECSRLNKRGYIFNG